MDLTMLKYIVTIAEEKKLSRASEKLFITSSALSQCIKKLEGELGIPVFEKINNQTFHLTEGGRVYVEAAEEILKIKEQTYRILEDVQHANRGHFTFGCSPKRGLAMLSNIYPKFYKTYPDVKIDLQEANLNTLRDSVLNGSVDIAILTPLTEEHKLLNLEPIDQEEVVLAIPFDHPLAHLADKNGMGTIPLTDLKLFKSDNWMLANKDSMHRNLTDQLFKQAGFSPDKILLETSTTAVHLSAIEEGIAVSLVPMPRNPDEVKMIKLHLEPRPYRRLYAAYRKSYLLSKNQRYFIDLMAEFYRTARNQTLPPHRTGW